MKLKEGFITHDMDGEQILISAGEVKFSGVVRSNKTSAFIIDCLKEDTTKEAIIKLMLEKYDASEEQISRDVDLVIGKLRSIDAIDE